MSMATLTIVLIVGLVLIAVALLLGALGAVLFFWWRKRLQKKKFVSFFVLGLLIF